MSVFIDRERELGFLGERYSSGKAEFVIIYGRRRIGKTELIERFLASNKVNGLRLLAREESKLLQLKRFRKALAEYFNDPVLGRMEFNEWDAFFEYLSAKCEKERIVIAIDEFPYLVKEDKSLPSILQDYWDRKLKDGKIFLILCGSSISMMEKLMGYKSPIYGRRTGQILVKPFRFEEVLNYIKNLEKAVEFHSVFGGTPAYVLEIDKDRDILSNIRSKILREDSFIFRDVEFLLREEIEEPRYYFSILLSISKGNNKLGLICNDTGLSKSIVNKYLSVLIDLHLVKRMVPVTESLKSKKGQYFISDNLFEFWFRFVYPNIEKIERDEIDLVINRDVKPHLNQFIGRKFEDICEELLWKLKISDFTRIGKWWHKDKEIDIVALDEGKKEILLAECKWKDEVNAGKIVKELAEKSSYVDWYNEEREEKFAIFAKSFSNRVEEFEGKKVYCFDLEDLEKYIGVQDGYPISH